jgi:hypothetical protein
MTIAITTSGIALDGPLVAGEKVAVTVSGLALAAEDKPTLALLARFPDALLASVELAEDADAPGTWTGELDTATKQTALFFATARADERRDAALELVAGRVSLARLTVPMANSALCPKPDGSPFASPVYVPVPGPPGQGGDPYDQAPEMDGEASAGVSDEYARGDHRHPTDNTRQAVIEDLAAIRSGAAAGATAVQPSALSAYRTASAQDEIDGGKLNATGLTNNNGQLGALDFVTRYSFGFEGGKFITAPENSGAALTDNDIADSSSALGGALAAKANSSDLATVATTGDYADLKNKPTIPGPAPVTSVNGDTGDVAIYGNTLIMAQGQSTLVSSAIANAQGDATRALNELPFKAYSGSLAPAFSTSSTYAVGDYCTREGLLYKCTTAVSTAGAWDSTKWSAVAVTDEMGADTPLPFDAECEYITVPAGVYFTPGVANISPDLRLIARIRLASIPESGKNVVIGNWRGQSIASTQVFVTDSGSGAMNFSTSSMGNSASSLIGQFGDIGIEGGMAFCGTTQIVLQTTNVISAPLDISIGAGALADGTYSPSSNDFDLASFEYQSCGYGCKFISVRVGTAGCLYDTVNGVLLMPHGGSCVPGPDKATPTITTPGRIVELTPAIRYVFASPTPTVSGTAATVACEDRAINDFTVATGITSLTITPPAAVTGRARDFFCRVTLTDSSLPTVTLSGATIDIGASEVAGMTQGVNLLMFTEIASGHWLASRRSAS